MFLPANATTLLTPLNRQTYLILDNKTGRVVCVLACPPDDPTWEGTHAAAAEYLKESGPKCSYPTRKDKDTGEIKIPRRGDFGALSCGISHGGGQTVRLDYPLGNIYANDQSRLPKTSSTRQRKMRKYSKGSETTGHSRELPATGQVRETFELERAI